MADTGADITVVSSAECPKEWGLKPVNESVTGIGGSAASMWSANNIIIKALDSHIVSVQLYVINSGFTLWGKDLLSQWGTRLEIPPPYQDF